MKLLGASKSIFNKLLHPLSVPVSHHLAIHLQPRFHGLLLLLPQLEEALLVLLAEVHHIVPYLLGRRCRGQAKNALAEFLLLETKMAQEVYYYFIVGDYRRCVS